MRKPITIAVLVAAVVIAGCSDPKTAKRVLEQNGFSEIEVTGYAAWSCGQGDDYATGFHALTPAKVYVTGAVCSGWGKGATIRFD